MLRLMGDMVKDQAMRPINWLKDKYNSLKTFMAGIELPDLSWSSIKDTLKDMVNLLIGLFPIPSITQVNSFIILFMLMNA